MLTAEYVRSIFDYDPKTGFVTRRVSTCNRVKVGDVVGCPKETHPGKPYSRTYLQVRVKVRLILVHRLIWLWMTGELPPRGMQVDHEDGNGLNNAWRNLRLATREQNMANTGVRKTKRTGLPKGIHFHARDGLYVARFRGKPVKYSKSMDEAKAAYDAAARAAYGEFFRE